MVSVSGPQLQPASREGSLGRFVSSEAGAASVLLALVFLVRIVAAATTPLTEDEAYYRLWSQHLAFGYYDHPPMIAWWIRLGITVAGDGPFGVRALPVLASAVTSLLVFDLTRRLGGSQRTAWRATLWYNATLTVGLGAMLAAPDAPASLFWVLTLCCLARARNDDRWWLAVGAAAGLGILSKYSALFLGPGILLWLLCDKSRSASLARPWVWLGGVTAGLIALPNLIWNAQHHWATVAKQFGRMAPVGFAPLHLPQFLIFQPLLFGPVLLLFVWPYARMERRRGRPRPWSPRPARPSWAISCCIACTVKSKSIGLSRCSRAVRFWPPWAPISGPCHLGVRDFPASVLPHQP